MLYALLLAVVALQVPSDRDAFSFLIGTWELESRLDVAKGTTEAGTDRYEFRQPIRGGAIQATWRFNRGSEAKPDWADALYVSGYHDSTKSWSFYYVSERSAQHWVGRKAGDRWYFYFDEPFDYEGRRAVQRQWWERVEANRIRRHFENSYDGGKTWQLAVSATLRRAPG